MPIFSLKASRSYDPNSNPLVRFGGYVGATSNSITVGITGVDAGVLSTISSLTASGRTVTVYGTYVPAGGTATGYSNGTLTLSYPSAVSATATPSPVRLDYYLGDAPNHTQALISSVVYTGVATLSYVDSDGSTATITTTNSTGQLQLNVLRTLSGTTGSIWGVSKGSAL
jgi:hypothetical protein